MTSSPPRAMRPTAAFLATAALLAAGLIDLRAGPARSIRQGLKAPEMNRADREANAGGYYEGLINVGSDGTRSDLTLKLLGKPDDWVKFADLGATRDLPGDPLQFELRPGVRQVVFGQPFGTSSAGLRDREYTPAKPPGTYRIALLGSSMDMGWGVGDRETYETRLEDWLNAHARKRDLPRRYEVINFAVAAYGPLQRLETYRRKAVAYDPDLVIYSATMLDNRLLEIHLCSLLQGGVDLRDFPFLTTAVARSGIGPEDLRPDARKGALKAKLRPELWGISDAALGALASACRSEGRVLVCAIIPRVGALDEPAARAEGVARHVGIATRHGVPVLDLSATFDGEEPADLEIAAWDDHPNARGHALLFYALANRIVAREDLYREVFGIARRGFKDIP